MQRTHPFAVLNSIHFETSFSLRLTQTFPDAKQKFLLFLILLNIEMGRDIISSFCLQQPLVFLKTHYVHLVFNRTTRLLSPSLVIF